MDVIDKMMDMQPKFSQRFKFKLNEDILKLDLGMSHMMVMNIVSRSKTPPILSEIAETLSISYPMMTYIIDRMESKKLLL